MSRIRSALLGVACAIALVGAACANSGGSGGAPPAAVNADASASDGGTNTDGQGPQCSVTTCTAGETCCAGLECMQGICTDPKASCEGDKCGAGLGGGGCCAGSPKCGTDDLKTLTVTTCKTGCFEANKGCIDDGDCCSGLTCEKGVCSPPSCSGASCEGTGHFGNVGSPCCAASPFCGASTPGGTKHCRAACVPDGGACVDSFDCCPGSGCADGECVPGGAACEGSSCTAGAAGGGCCDAAPNCIGVGHHPGKICLSVCGSEGWSCTATSDCCGGLACKGGFCKPAAGASCAGEACGAGGGSCCVSSPFCSGGASSSKTACRGWCGRQGNLCATADDCCGGKSCVGGKCSASPACGEATTACNGPSDCCSGQCTSGRCDATPTIDLSCATTSHVCSAATDCCPGLGCLGGLCLPGSSCQDMAHPCGAAKPCCSGLVCESGYCTLDLPTPPPSPGGGGGAAACSFHGQTCATKPCCAGLSCGPSGRCLLCRSAGDGCKSTNDCCAGLACVAGVCKTNKTGPGGGSTPPPSGCNGDFEINQSIQYDPSAGLGHACDKVPLAHNCVDGTSIIFGGGACSCMADCYALEMREGEVCDSAGNWHCRRLRNQSGVTNGFLGCVRDSWNLCTAR